MIQALAILIASVARAVVGSGHLSRGIAYPIAAALAAYVGFGADWWAVPFTIVPAAVLWLGRTKWEDRLYTVARLGAAPTALGAVHYVLTGHFGGIWWGLACMAMAVIDIDIRERLDHVRIELPGDFVIDSARVAEFVNGAVILGGVALL